MTLETKLDPLPVAPSTGGMLGEMDALHSALSAAGSPIARSMLLGVSGLAFSFGFRVNTDTRTGQNPQFGWFRPAQWDGPDPLRLAARLAGFDFTSHLVNSTSGMFQRVMQSIDARVAVLTRDPQPPHHPCLIIGYTCDDNLGPPRALHMVRCPGDNGEGQAGGPQQQIRVELPVDPESVMLEIGPWRNPIGVLERRSEPNDGSVQNQLRAGLRRAAAISATRVISASGDDAPMLDGDVLDEEVRSSLVRPSFATWANTVRGGHVDVVSLRIALNDLHAARSAAAAFLIDSCASSGWDTVAAGELFHEVASQVAECRALVPAGEAELDEASAAAVATALDALNETEARGIGALTSVMNG
ncbi:MAG: hypothetical protein AB7K09_07610 [Planctomycetota bacterium]